MREVHVEDIMKLLDTMNLSCYVDKKDRDLTGIEVNIDYTFRYYLTILNLYPKLKDGKPEFRITRRDTELFLIIPYELRRMIEESFKVSIVSNALLDLLQPDKLNLLTEEKIVGRIRFHLMEIYYDALQMLSNKMRSLKVKKRIYKQKKADLEILKNFEEDILQFQNRLLCLEINQDTKERSTESSFDKKDDLNVTGTNYGGGINVMNGVEFDEITPDEWLSMSLHDVLEKLSRITVDNDKYYLLEILSFIKLEILEHETIGVYARLRIRDDIRFSNETGDLISNCFFEGIKLITNTPEWRHVKEFGQESVEMMKRFIDINRNHLLKFVTYCMCDIIKSGEFNYGIREKVPPNVISEAEEHLLNDLYYVEGGD